MSDVLPACLLHIPDNVDANNAVAPPDPAPALGQPQPQPQPQPAAPITTIAAAANQQAAAPGASPAAPPCGHTNHGHPPVGAAGSPALAVHTPQPPIALQPLGTHTAHPAVPQAHGTPAPVIAAPAAPPAAPATQLTPPGPAAAVAPLVAQAAAHNVASPSATMATQPAMLGAHGMQPAPAAAAAHASAASPNSPWAAQLNTNIGLTSLGAQTTQDAGAAAAAAAAPAAVAQMQAAQLAAPAVGLMPPPDLPVLTQAQPNVVQVLSFGPPVHAGVRIVLPNGQVVQRVRQPRNG